MLKEPIFSALPDLEFREIEHGSPEYDLAVELRDRILRKPLGLEFSPAQLAAEAEDTHVAVFAKSGEILGCAVLTWPSPDHVKLRQVAIDSDQQNRGFGAELVRFAESIARKCGATRIFCNARQTVSEFYAKMDYQLVGEPFEEVGIPHHRMEKSLD